MNFLSLLLIVVAISCLFFEIFIVSFGVLTLLGVLSFIGSFFITIRYLQYPYLVILSEIIIIGVIIYACYKYFKKYNIQDKIILKETLKFSELNTNEFEKLLEKEGTSLTPLKPFGYAKVDNKTLEVYSTGKYITNNEKIKVVKINDLEQKIYVEKLI